jgi:hypothetical protein
MGSSKKRKETLRDLAMRGERTLDESRQFFPLDPGFWEARATGDESPELARLHAIEEAYALESPPWGMTSDELECAFHHAIIHYGETLGELEAEKYVEERGKALRQLEAAENKWEEVRAAGVQGSRGRGEIRKMAAYADDIESREPTFPRRKMRSLRERLGSDFGCLPLRVQLDLAGYGPRGDPRSGEPFFKGVRQ